MRKAIFYISYYRNNTVKIIESMNRILKADLYNLVDNINPEIVNNYDIIGLGSGIYFTRHHERLLNFASKITNGKNKKVFLFSTRCNINLGKYHNSLKKILQEKEIQIIGEFSVPAFDATGPFRYIGGMNKFRPNHKDLWKAESFARNILLKYAELSHFTNEQSDTIIGKKVQINTKQCCACGKCESICPLHVFDIIKKSSQSYASPVRELDCIQCLLCVENCKEAAIKINGNWRDSFRIVWRHRNR